MELHGRRTTRPWPPFKCAAQSSNLVGVKAGRGPGLLRPTKLLPRRCPVFPVLACGGEVGHSRPGLGGMVKVAVAAADLMISSPHPRPAAVAVCRLGVCVHA